MTKPTTEQDVIKTVNALYLELPESIADAVKLRILSFLDWNKEYIGGLEEKIDELEQETIKLSNRIFGLEQDLKFLKEGT